MKVRETLPGGDGRQSSQNRTQLIQQHLKLVLELQQHLEDMENEIVLCRAKAAQLRDREFSEKTMAPVTNMLESVEQRFEGLFKDYNRHAQKTREYLAELDNKK